MTLGVAAVVAAWLLVRLSGVSVWLAQGIAVTAAAVAALSTGRVHLSPRFSWIGAAVAGVAAGIALYAATAGFVLVATRAPAFARHVRAIYDQRGGLSLPVALLLASAVIAPGEEIFWRGLFQGRLADAHGWTASAVVTWATYCGANAVGGSLPIVAGAVVGGAAWGALALWTHGVLAGALCHSLWTGLMLARPPRSSGAT